MAPFFHKWRSFASGLCGCDRLKNDHRGRAPEEEEDPCTMWEITFTYPAGLPATRKADGSKRNRGGSSFRCCLWTKPFLFCCPPDGPNSNSIFRDEQRAKRFLPRAASGDKATQLFILFLLNIVCGGHTRGTLLYQVRNGVECHRQSVLISTCWGPSSLGGLVQGHPLRERTLSTFECIPGRNLPCPRWFQSCIATSDPGR